MDIDFCANENQVREGTVVFVVFLGRDQQQLSSDDFEFVCDMAPPNQKSWRPLGPGFPVPDGRGY